MTTFHKAKYVYTNGKIIENTGFFVQNGRIIPSASEYEAIDHGNALITPGFINFHTHLQYTDLVKSKQPKDFSGWLTELIKQYFFWNRDKKEKSLMNGLNETVQSGVTCLVNLAIEDEFIEILDSSGIKAYSFLETFSDSEQRTEKEFKKLIKSLEKYNTSYVGVSPHAPYNIHPTMWKKLLEIDVLINTHLAESADEMQWMNGNLSNIQKMHKLVMFKTLKPYNVHDYLSPFGDRLITAHLNQLNFDDVKHYNIAHCPRSNMLLHGKTLHIVSDTGKIGLGTDSKFSNHDLNILHEAKFLRDLGNLSFIEIMNILTINPARMLKLDSLIGSLETGKDADFLVFNLNETELPESILDRDTPDEMFVKGKRL